MAVSTTEAYAQGKREKKTKRNKPPQNPEDAAKYEEEKQKQLDRDIAKVRRDYKKSLDKKTAKRMKKNRGKSRRYAQNKKEPFLKRLFSRKTKRGKRVKD